MLIESLILGGVALNALVTFAPELIGLGERVTDSRNFTINVAAVGPEVIVVSYDAPSELNVGHIPTVTLTVEHTRPNPEWVFARVRDIDTGSLVTITKKVYMVTPGTMNFTLSGRDWTTVMPNRTWNLQLEVGLWWV